MAAMAFVTQPWHVLALRAVQGLFAGYGGLDPAMAAESAPRDSHAVGDRRRADGAAPRPGGRPADRRRPRRLVGLRRAFLVTALLCGRLVLVLVLYDDNARAHAAETGVESGRVTFRNVLAFQNFLLMMFVIFGLQFVDRSFGPVLPLWVEQVGVAHARVPLVAGVLFSIIAFTGALGHHFCGTLLQRFSTRARHRRRGGGGVRGYAPLIAVAGNFWLMCAASVLFGIGIGAAMTAAYQRRGRGDSARRARRRLRRPDERVARRHGEQPVHRRLSRRRVIRVVFVVDAA